MIEDRNQNQSLRNEMHTSDEAETYSESISSTISEFDPSSRLMKEFNILGHIGSGAFANVYQVRNKLDSSLYALKRIKLNFDENGQLGKKITKEVELLSKLNHQNVVRYYNSWLEDFESHWENNSMYRTDDFIAVDVGEEIEDDDSNSIIFQYSEMKSENTRSSNNISLGYTHMCIQMEYCEQSTLRNAIDDNLYQDQDRVWQLIEQSVGGLAYIHEKGIIHRDLKPDNIFIDGNGRVKIGDFGLATLIDSLHGDTKSSHTGDVGTPLYDAPELKSSGAKVRYDQKIDMYSLGIIFFEMCYPPFQTVMEKKKVLSNLRKSPAKVSQYISLTISKKRDPFSQELCFSKENQSRLIRELLDHNPEKRPRASEILKNCYLLDKMCRLSIALPMIANSSFEGKMSTSRPCYLQDFDLHDDNLWKANAIEMVSDKVREIFRLHGGTFYPCRFPLDWIDGQNISIIKPFASYLVANPRITHMKRYTFNELSESFFSKSFNQPFQCATFDIVSSISTNLAMEIEVILMVCEFLERFSGRIRMNDFVIRLSHGSLTPRVKRHILEHSGLETDHPILLEEFISYTCIRDINIEEWKLIESVQVEEDSSLTSHVLHLIFQDEGLNDIERKSFDELDRLVDLIKSLDIKCPVVIAPSLMNNYEYSNIMFQVVHKDYISYTGSESGVVAAGRRYDKLIAEPKCDSDRECVFRRSAVGLTIYFDQFVEILNPETKLSTFEVLVCSIDSSKLLKEKLKLSKELWAAEIRSSISYVEHAKLEEIEKYCKEMKIPYLLFLEGTEEVKVILCSSTRDCFQKKDFALWEVVPYLRKIIKGN